MYNYHADIVWAVNIVLVGLIVLTSILIFISVVFKNLLVAIRRRALLKIKQNVYEMVMAGSQPQGAVRQSFIASLTPQQFIDIETNRNVELGFFNESEQQFFRKCFINPENVTKLEKTAKSSINKWRRIEALLSLGYMKTGSAIGILKDSLFSKDKDIVYFSIIALGQIKTVESAKVLLDFLRRDPSNSYKIITILEEFPKEITCEVIKLVDYHDPQVRLWAVTLLAALTSIEHLKKLEKLVHDENHEIRAAACDCLGNMGSVEVRQALIEALKDDDWLVRSHAVSALSKVLGPASIPQIIGLINDGSWAVIDAVRDAMTAYIEASLPYIEKFLEGKDELAKKTSVLALQNSGYLAKLLKEAVSGKAKESDIAVLRGVVRSRVHSGLDAVLGELEPAMRDKALELLMGMEGR